MLAVLGWAIWSLSGLLCLTSLLVSLSSQDGGARMLARWVALVLAVGIVVTGFGWLSKFHLIWWAPAGFCASMAYFSIRTQIILTKLVKEHMSERAEESDELGTR